jgi:hypothetical protein
LKDSAVAQDHQTQAEAVAVQAPQAVQQRSVLLMVLVALVHQIHIQAHPLAMLAVAVVHPTLEQVEQLPTEAVQEEVVQVLLLMAVMELIIVVVVVVLVTTLLVEQMRRMAATVVLE